MWRPLGHAGGACTCCDTQGVLDDAFVRALVALATDPFQPSVFAGGHRCGFCRLSGGSGFRYENQDVSIGSANIFVPDGERLFAAPSMILHYMDAHEYAPAANFQRAVLTLAMSPNERTLYLVTIERGPRARIITVRRASTHERRIYEGEP